MNVGMTLKGLALGLVSGLALVCFLQLHASFNLSVSPAASGQGRTDVKVLDAGEPDQSEEIKPDRRSEYLKLVIESWRRVGDYQKAMDEAEAATDATQRDFLLKFLADRMLLSYSTDKFTSESYLSENGGEAKVRSLLPAFQQVVDRVHKDIYKIPLLLRLDAVQNMLEPNSKQPRPDRNTLIIQAASLAEKLQPDSASLQSGKPRPYAASMDLKLMGVLTALLGLIGVILASILDPTFKALGVVIGASLAKQIGKTPLVQAVRSYDSELMEHLKSEMSNRAVTGSPPAGSRAQSDTTHSAEK